MPEGQIIITMAGNSRRFREAGFTQPKYMLDAHGCSLFAWSVWSLRAFWSAGWPVAFVAQAAHGAKAFIAAECHKMGIEGFSVMELDSPTSGQAATAQAARIPDPARPILIYNIDTLIEPSVIKLEMWDAASGWIPCFAGMGDGWSFARTDPVTGQVVEVREKQRISQHCSLGLYGFPSFASFDAAVQRYYADPGRLERGETYIAPVYNQLVANGVPVTLANIPVEAVHPLGTPDEWARFTARPWSGKDRPYQS